MKKKGDVELAPLGGQVLKEADLFMDNEPTIYSHHNTTQKQKKILPKNRKTNWKNKMEKNGEYEMELGQNRENTLETDKSKKYLLKKFFHSL